jgi:hypothetical protein
MCIRCQDAAAARRLTVAYIYTPPENGIARSLLNQAVLRGKLTRGPCEVCGSTRVHGHHDDYAKPLDVRWLCAKHHKALHLGR